MPTIVKRGSRYRAQIRERGHNFCKSFASEEEARSWANSVSLDLRATGNMRPPIAKIRAAGEYDARVGAVYFLFAMDGELLYVGRTGDLHRRLVRHRENKEIPFSTFSVISCDDAETRASIEAYYINELHPPHNKAGLRWARPE